MEGLRLWKLVARDEADLLGTFVRCLDEHAIRHCVIGDVAVNAYSEPVIGVEFDVAVAADQAAALEAVMRQEFEVTRVSSGLDVSVAGSGLRVRIVNDPRYAAFVARARPRDVLGLTLSVAAIEDVLQGKIWAASDPSRRASKRQKDLADISRLLEFREDLRARVPPDILGRLL